MGNGPVVIVGGGVAGLAVANALAARGCESLFFERAKAPGEIDRGDVIHEASMKYLDRWNASPALREQAPLEITTFRVLDNHGEALFHFDLARDLAPPARFTVLAHPEIQRALEQAAINTRRVTVVRGTACTGLVVRGARVVGVNLRDEVVEAPLTIVANGAFSTLRDGFGRRSDYEYPAVFLNLRCERVADLDECAYYVIGEEGVMIMAPLPRGQMRIGLQLPAGAVRPAGPALAAEVQRRLRTFPVHTLNVLEAHVYKLTRSLSPTMWTPGAVLAGDAAHTTHPVGGQGMNLAFQDADVLARCLADVNFDSTRMDEAASRYGRERRAAITRVLRRTHVMGLAAGIRNPAYIRARAGVLRLANRAPLLKRWIFQRVVEVR
jgi:2-polyprenyl-6-methoxyphenol hydroxylase-like FAD-dependent oxidoreductase